MEPKKGIDIADFPTIFQSLTSGRRTGNLKVSTGTGSFFFYFQDGVIRHFAQPARDDVLLRAMLHCAKIDRTGYEKLLSRHRRSGRSYLSLFSAKRTITDADITQAMQFMVQEEVCDLFVRSRLNCEFFEGEPFPEVFGTEKERVTLSVLPEPVVMEAARRMDEVSLLREIVPSTSDVYTVTGVTEEQLEAPLPPEDAGPREEVLDLIDGHRDIEDLAALARMSKFDLLRRLAQLAGARVVEALGARSLLTLAQQYAIEGNIRKALRLYERAEELGEARMETRMHIARLYGALCDEKRALAKYISISEDALKSNDTDGAITAIRQALHLAPENTEVRERLAALLLQSDRYDEAINESIELANLLVKAKNLDGAVQIWLSFMDKYPTSTESHRQLAELYKERENRTAAIQVLESLAELYLTRARRERAVEVYREVLKLDPKHTGVRLKLASLLRRIGNVKEAAREYEKFRSSTRMLRFSKRPQTILRSWFGLRHPTVIASARLALSGPALRAIAILALGLVLAGVLTLIFSVTVASQGNELGPGIGSVLFGALVIMHIVMAIGVLPLLASASVLLHPHEDDESVAAQLVAHPRGAVAGKFVATLSTWLILLLATLPLAATVVLLRGASGPVVSLNFYLQILVGAVIAAALTLVCANAPDRKSAIVDSYLVCAALALLGVLFVSMLSDVGGTGSGSLLAKPVSMTDLPAFQLRTSTFVGTALLMPIAAVFVCGFILMAAVARLTPERGYSSPAQKLFWLIVILLGTAIGLAWASTGDHASSLSQPPVAQLLLLMSVFLALSIGAIVFSTESAPPVTAENESVKKLLSRSRLKLMLGPGPLRGSLFALAGSAIVLFVVMLFLGLSESSATPTKLSGGVLTAVYFAILGHVTLVISLGLLLSTTQLSGRWRRLILISVLGITLAGIPAAMTYMQFHIPRLVADLSPLVLAAAAFGKSITTEKYIWRAEAINWGWVVAVYWAAAAAIGTAAVLRLRRSTRGSTQKGGKSK